MAGPESDEVSMAPEPGEMSSSHGSPHAIIDRLSHVADLYGGSSYPAVESPTVESPTVESPTVYSVTGHDILDLVLTMASGWFLNLTATERDNC